MQKNAMCNSLMNWVRFCNHWHMQDRTFMPRWKLLQLQQYGSGSNSASKVSLLDLSNGESQSGFMPSNAPGSDLLQTAGYYQPGKHLRACGWKENEDLKSGSKLEERKPVTLQNNVLEVDVEVKANAFQGWPVQSERRLNLGHYTVHRGTISKGK